MATDEQATKIIERTLQELEEISVEMIKMRAELEFRIDQISKLSVHLKHLLPMEKRKEE